MSRLAAFRWDLVCARARHLRHDRRQQSDPLSNLAGDWDPVSVRHGRRDRRPPDPLRLILRRPTPLYDVTFHLPTAKGGTRNSSADRLFGVGWGLGGFVPAPGSSR